MSDITIGPGTIAGDFTASSITFPLEGKTLFVVKADGSIERGEGFTTEDEMSLHFWAMIEELGMQRAKPSRIMTEAMMDAGQRYLDSVTLTLPDTFNWHEFWQTIIDA